jgi:hypothetical protein
MTVDENLSSKPAFSLEGGESSNSYKIWQFINNCLRKYDTTSIICIFKSPVLRENMTLDPPLAI